MDLSDAGFKVLNCSVGWLGIEAASPRFGPDLASDWMRLPFLVGFRGFEHRLEKPLVLFFAGVKGRPGERVVVVAHVPGHIFRLLRIGTRCIPHQDRCGFERLFKGVDGLLLNLLGSKEFFAGPSVPLAPTAKQAHGDEPQPGVAVVFLPELIYELGQTIEKPGIGVVRGDADLGTFDSRSGRLPLGGFQPGFQQVVRNCGRFAGVFQVDSENRLPSPRTDIFEQVFDGSPVVIALSGHELVERQIAELHAAREEVFGLADVRHQAF